LTLTITPARREANRSVSKEHNAGAPPKDGCAMTTPGCHHDNSSIVTGPRSARRDDNPNLRQGHRAPLASYLAAAQRYTSIRRAHQIDVSDFKNT
jgi:hypothetical protein